MDIYRELAEEAFVSSGIKGEAVSAGRYCTINSFHIHNEEEEDKMNRPRGDYISLSFDKKKFGRPSLLRDISKNTSAIIRKLGDGCLEKTLVVGLGNAKITSDSLGTATVDALASAGTNAMLLKPSVFGETKIESAKLVLGAVNQVCPSLVLVIDTLTCMGADRLYGSVQLSNAGLTPGAGLGNSRTPLTKKTMGIPVLSVGIPLISYPQYSADSSLCVTPKEIDIIVKLCAETLCNAIKTALK